MQLKNSLSNFLFLLILLTTFTSCSTPKQPQASATPGLMGRWDLNEGSGTIAHDTSGNANTGTLINGPTWVQGKNSQALSFNGSSQYVSVPNSSSLNLPAASAVTMCAWVYSTSGSTGSYQGIMAKRTAFGGPYDYGINFITGQFQVYTQGKSGIIGFNYDLPVKTWTHVCGVISSGPTALYINGALFGSAGSGGGVMSDNSIFQIGGSYSDTNGGNEVFNGIIQDVYVYDRALSASEIASLYKS